MVNKKKFALCMWILIGGIHLIRALCVLIIPVAFQNFLNRIFDMHFLQPYRIITPFNFWNMIILVVFTFVMGCIIGLIMGTILNIVLKPKKK